MPYIGEGQTIQWSKETGQMDKQRSTKRRRTNNTMANRKSTKGQTTIYKTYT